MYSGTEGVEQGKRGGIFLTEGLEMLLVRLHNSS